MARRLRLDEGWSTFILLWAMLLVASTAIMLTELIDGLHIVPVATTLGMFAGMALAKSKFKDSTAHLISVVYGLFVVFYLVGTILPGDLLWRERVVDIIVRQVAWIGKAIDGGTSRDGLIFVIQTTVVYWLLGYTAAWYTFRYPRVWRATVPTGLVLLSVVYYYNGPRPLLLYLAAYALLALLFVARTHLMAQEIDWRAASVRYERGIWFDFLRAGFVVATVVLLLAWTLPAFSASPVMNDALSGTQGPWREFQDNWTRLFSSLRSYGSATTDPYQDTLVLGGPRTVGSTLIMDVIVPEQLPSVYWQAVAYESYENGRWDISGDASSQLHFPDDGILDVPGTAMREIVEQVVVNYLPNSSYLYAAPEVIGSNRQMFVESIEDEEGRALVSSIRSRFVLRQGDRYQVASRISTADASSLRVAGTNYPAWVTDRYLQVPDTITAETRALATELAGPYDNAFDKSIAIRDYLRENITYNDQIPAPPEGVDPVHYTLFQSREGYCNYYASAMALMLRSEGVPARVVSGYAQGEFDEESSSYRVRASNAHTWVEVYFPAFGWIQFEPTASIPLVERPEGTGGGDAFASPVLPGEDGTDFESMTAEEEFLAEQESLRDFLNEDIATASEGGLLANFPTWQALGVLVVLLVAGVLVMVGNGMNRRVESDIDGSYQRLGFWARLLGIFFGEAETPHERAARMSMAVPQGQEPIDNLTNQYVRRRFSAQQAPDEGFDAYGEWKQLRPLLIRESVANRWRAWRRRLRR